MLGPNRFTFLSDTAEIAVASDWNNPALPKLWLYNAHYFDDLTAADAGQRYTWHVALINRWVQENPPGFGNGWEPYPISLRLVNWIKWAWSGHELPDAAHQSMAVQARLLTASLEYHLLGNHLWANAKALVFVGCFFQGEEARAWLAQGLRLILEQIDEQVLADGGHFELTVMYHSIFLEDIFDLVQVGRLFPDRIDAKALVTLERTGAMMMTWLVGMLHPDGEIALFNDAAFDIAVTPSSLMDQARRLGIAVDDTPSSPLLHHAESGYIRLQFGQAVAWLDVGKIGPDYLPGHAHADSLSLELSIGAHRVLVDTGTSTYAASPERLRQRGTAAHNTVVVDDLDSSEVWGSFRVARRAQPMGLTIDAQPAGVSVQAAHSGYRRLKHPTVHRRTWAMSAGALTITDVISRRGGPGSGRAVAYWHLGPAIVEVLGNAPGRFDCRLADGQTVCFEFDTGAVSVEPAQWHCRFGEAVPIRRIAVVFAGEQLVTRISWS